MQRTAFHRIVASLVIAVSVGFSACGGSASPDSSDSTNATASRRAPSGAYKTQLPDGTTIQLGFRDAGAVAIAMTEGGQTNTHEGKWVLNGEVILVEGGEGMTMQLSWRGDELVTDFGGATLTFSKT